MTTGLPHVDPRACRKLWQALLLDQLSLVLAEHDPVSGMTGHVEVQRAQAWVGSRAFREVCLLAGIDPDWCLGAVRRELARPKHLRAITLQARYVRRSYAQRRPGRGRVA